jgi:hypothetical protein
MKRSTSHNLTKDHISDAANRAWALWHHMTNVADRLWDDYEREFQQLAIRDSETYNYKSRSDDQGDLPF